MRCLYCGNELALLKKLTGGGEFCSEAHRQKYQEEYNRLALSRLLQAQPSSDERPPLETSKKSRRPELVGNRAVRDTRSEAPVVVPGGGRTDGKVPAPATPLTDQPPPEPSFLMARFEPVLCPNELHPDGPFPPAATAVVPDPEVRSAGNLGFGQPGQVPLPAFVTGWPGESDSILKILEPKGFNRSAAFFLTLPGRRGGVGPKAALTPHAVRLMAAVLPFAERRFAPISLTSSPEFLENLACLIAGLRDDDPPPSDDLMRPPGDELEATVQPVQPGGSVPSGADSEFATSVDNGIQPDAPPLTPPAASSELRHDTKVVEVGPSVWMVPLDDDFRPTQREVFIDLDLFDTEHETVPNPSNTTDIEKTVTPDPAPAETATTATPEFHQAEPESRPAQVDSGAPGQPVSDSSPLQHMVSETPEEGPAVEVPAEQTDPADEIEANEPVSSPAVLEITTVVETAPAVVSQQSEEPGLAAQAGDCATGAGGTEMAEEPPTTTDESERASDLVESAREESEVSDEAAMPTAAPADLPRRSEKVLVIAFDPAAGPRATSTALPAVPVAAFRVAPPTLDAVPIRPRMIFGPKPGQPAATPPETVDPSPGEGGISRTLQPARVPAEPPPDAAAKTQRPPVVAAGDTPATPAPRQTPLRPGAAARQVREDDGGADALESLRFGLESKPPSGWRGMGASKSKSKKIAIGVGLCLALLISAILIRSTFAAKAGSAHFEPPSEETVGASSITDGQSWNEDWNGEPGGGRIVLYQPSAALADYRISYAGKVGDRGIGWVFRAVNPRNYYVTQIQVANAGATPAAMLVHYAVINGENTSRGEKPLPFSLQEDRVYNIRTDVLGTLFSTYVQDQLVDSWTDDRLKSGGFGILGADGDRSRFGLQELRAGQ